MKKNIVILGSTGTVGSKIAQILINEGHHVTLVARHTEKLEKYANQGATIVATDVADADQLTQAFTGADSAFVISPDYVKAEDTRAYQRQVTGTLIEAIQRSGIRYIVNMSSLGSHMHEGYGVQLPVERVREVFLGNGFSTDFISNLIEMGIAISTGYMNYQKRDELTTTQTTAEEFARQVYAPAYYQ